MGSHAVVFPEDSLTVSEISVVAVSPLSVSLSTLCVSAVLQHESNFGLFQLYFFTRLTNNPSQMCTNNSVICGGMCISGWLSEVWFSIYISTADKF